MSMRSPLWDMELQALHGLLVYAYCQASGPFVECVCGVVSSR